MNRLPFILSAIAVAVLAGCATTKAASRRHLRPSWHLRPRRSSGTRSRGSRGTHLFGRRRRYYGRGAERQRSPTVVVAPQRPPLRVGFGRIDSILVVPNAAAGGTAPNTSKRVAMRMDDGTMQYFDTKADNLKVGDRIEITTNGTLRHPA